jgi:YesN/AraC family two-component response regulator
MHTMKQHLSVHKCAIFVIIALLFSVSIVSAQDDYQQKKDSLLKVLATAQGDDKLQTLSLLEHLNLPQPDSLLMFNDMHFKEAMKQSDMQSAGRAKQWKMIIFYNYNITENRIANAQDCLDFMQKHELWDLYFECYPLYISAFVFERHYNQALEKANALYAKAKEKEHKYGLAIATFSIADIYLNMNRYVEAGKWYRESISLHKSLGSKEYTLAKAYSNLTQCMLALDEFDQMQSVLNEWEENLKTDWNDITKYGAAWYSFYIRSAAYCFETNNLDQSEQYLAAADKALISPPAKINIYNYRAKIAIARKQYQQALEDNEQAYLLSLPVNDSQLTNEMREQKAEIICLLNGTNEASLLYEQVIAVNDSIRNLDLNAQLDELRTQYEVDKITAEKEKTRNYLIFALIGCLLLAIALGIWIYLHRQIARKNRSLYLQIQELLQKEKEAEKLLLEVPEAELSRTMQLFRSLSELMQQEKPFTDPELKRKTLSDRLGTNEIYLADAIREATGDTYSNYITNLRLQYSLELLNNQPNITFDAIAIDTGHGSYSAFFRSFAKKYGFTPSEYRKMAAAKRN